MSRRTTRTYEGGILSKEEITELDDLKHDLLVKEALESEPDADAAIQVVKSVDERRYTLGLSYPANRPDVAVAKDGHQDFTTEQVLERTAWSYLTKSRQIGLAHAQGTEGAGEVVESYIYRGPDWEVNGTTIKSGDWLLGCVWSEQAWPLIKSGQVNGYSFQGGAKRRQPSPEQIAGLRSH